MRKSTRYLLLALFLFTGKAMHGYSAEVSVSRAETVTLTNNPQHSPYSVAANSEPELSFTHSASADTQHAGVKKLPGYPTIQQLLVLDGCVAKIIPAQNAANKFTPPHLQLIFPFHYFW